MILEKQLIPFPDWLASSFPRFLAYVGLLVVFAIVVGYLLASARSGPGQAFAMIRRAIRSGWKDLRETSWRRVLALARLAAKESLRRYVIVVFLVFVIILLFAGWYLDVQSDNPARLYLSFVLKSTNFLVVLLAIFLSAFSLPTDIKNKTIYTVVTKPVRPWEIVLGRILGFVVIGTCILLAMLVVSYSFVRRGLDHQHLADVATVQESADGDGWDGRTNLSAHHRHRINIDADGLGTTDARMGHSHAASRDANGQISVGPPVGGLEARVPIYGKLRFLNRAGQPTDKGINTGNEWDYRGFVEGRTLSAGIFRFEGLESRDFPNGLPIEMTLRVFRTYTGTIERGILGTMRIVNGDPRVQEAALSADPAAKRGFDADTAVESEPIPFYAQEFTPDSRLIDRMITARMLDGSTREVDLFESLVHDGALEFKIQCEEPGQYYGMAQADLYVRAADNWFFWNFAKTYLTIWLQMVIVTSFGVMFSTFLTGSVAMLATLATCVLGYFSQQIANLASGQQEGGGPVESLIRIIKQDNLVTEMEPGVTTFIVKTFDHVAMLGMDGISKLTPNFRDFAEHGGINTARFVASGFDISAGLMGQHILAALAYFLVTTCAAYFFLKSKEVAA